MKFQITFKDPVALDLHKIAQESLFDDKDEDWEIAFGNLNFAQRKEIFDEVKASISVFLEQWMKKQEHITIEFNMDTKTAMVVPNMCQ